MELPLLKKVLLYNVWSFTPDGDGVLEPFKQDFELSVWRTYQFLVSKQVKNYVDFKWNVHRLWSLSSKAKQILSISKSHGLVASDEIDRPKLHCYWHNCSKSRLLLKWFLAVPFILHKEPDGTCICVCKEVYEQFYFSQKERPLEIFIVLAKLIIFLSQCQSFYSNKIFGILI